MEVREGVPRLIRARSKKKLYEHRRVVFGGGFVERQASFKGNRRISSEI